MVVLAPFPDPTKALVVYLGTLANAGSRVDVDLKSQMPFLLVYRYAGGDDYITDMPLVGVDAFASTYDAASDLAESARQRMIAAPYIISTADGLVLVDRGRTIEAPHEVPYGDTDVRRLAASYALELRR